MSEEAIFLRVGSQLKGKGVVEYGLMMRGNWNAFSYGKTMPNGIQKVMLGEQIAILH